MVYPPKNWTKLFNNLVNSIIFKNKQYMSDLIEI